MNEQMESRGRRRRRCCCCCGCCCSCKYWWWQQWWLMQRRRTFGNQGTAELEYDTRGIEENYEVYDDVYDEDYSDYNPYA